MNEWDNGTPERQYPGSICDADYAPGHLSFEDEFNQDYFDDETISSLGSSDGQSSLDATMSVATTSRGAERAQQRREAREAKNAKREQAAAARLAKKKERQAKALQRKEEKKAVREERAEDRKALREERAAVKASSKALAASTKAAAKGKAGAPGDSEKKKRLTYMQALAEKAKGRFADEMLSR